MKRDLHSLSRESILTGAPSLDSHDARTSYLCDALIAQERWNLKQQILGKGGEELSPEAQDFKLLDVVHEDLRIEYYSRLTSIEVSAHMAELSGYSEECDILHEVARKYAVERLGKKFADLEERLGIKTGQQKFETVNDGVNYLADALVSLRRWNLRKYYLKKSDIDKTLELSAQLEQQNRWLYDNNIKEKGDYYNDLNALRDKKVKELGVSIIKEWLVEEAIHLAKEYHISLSNLGKDTSEFEALFGNLPSSDETMLDINFPINIDGDKKPDDNTRQITERTLYNVGSSGGAEVEFKEIEDK